MNDKNEILNGTETEEASEEINETAEESSEEAEETAVEESGGKKEEKDPLGKRILNDIIDIAESTIVTIFIIGMVFTFLLHPVKVEGTSMNPTLNPDDKIMMTTVFFKLKYGDIIIIDNDTAYGLDDNGEPVAVNIDGNGLQECIIKRVIATPGQEIDIRDGKVFIDGEEIEEKYIMEGAQTKTIDAFNGQFPFKVPEGYYFVMGDNREHSSDSRDSHVGLIKKSQIYGKAILRYQPFDSFKYLGDSVNESAN